MFKKILHTLQKKHFSVFGGAPLNASEHEKNYVHKSSNYVKLCDFFFYCKAFKNQRYNGFFYSI